MTPPLLTAKEVAVLLAVPESWVREHTRMGNMPHIQLGRYIRYDRQEILAWLEHLRQGGGPEFREHFPRLTAGDDA